MQKHSKLGWVGLGVMGSAMCQHLIAAGYPMFINTRSHIKAEDLIAGGAVWCETPAEVAARSDVVFTMVGLEEEVRDVYLSADGLFVDSINGKTFIDMGTTAPRLTLELSRLAQQHDADFIDAPVSGGDVGARNASLSIMAGADPEILETVRPLFELLGRVQLMGGPGSGQHTKMCNQIVVAGTMIGVCEALVYASKAGLDCERLITTINQGAAGCWTLDNLAPRMISMDFAPGFMVDHFIKDLGIAVRETEMMGVKLPGLELAKSLYERVSNMGHGKSGTQALLLALQDIEYSA
ncbi:MAG: NAD(P)-dependent oxidoreductase [Gammaproteobacteria bacterium]|nr:NAD(P)-dependent oxidoreductase [Gammaproteobacteria bacterium]NNJ51101.1 NAD(P)-dependent oxidoreductase [Gammaproteobacteria bacterium]